MLWVGLLWHSSGDMIKFGALVSTPTLMTVVALQLHNPPTSVPHLSHPPSPKKHTKLPQPGGLSLIPGYFSLPTTLRRPYFSSCSTKLGKCRLSPHPIMSRKSKLFSHLAMPGFAYYYYYYFCSCFLAFRMIAFASFLTGKLERLYLKTGTPYSPLSFERVPNSQPVAGSHMLVGPVASWDLQACGRFPYVDGHQAFRTSSTPVHPMKSLNNLYYHLMTTTRKTGIAVIEWSGCIGILLNDCFAQWPRCWFWLWW